MGELIARYRWPIIIGAGALFLGFCVFVLVESPGWGYLVRLYEDKRLLKQTLREWGILAPIFFIVLPRQRRLAGTHRPSERVRILSHHDRSG